MILAWGFCNPNAIIISRHFKKVVRSILSIQADEADKLLARIEEDPKHGATFLEHYRIELNQRSKRGVPKEITKIHTVSSLYLVKRNSVAG
uniref:Uncharacterized protein n=1 Tax=Schistosoma haematobium TaxID=6185 RepID=A0A094ZSD6_SCHHA